MNTNRPQGRFEVVFTHKAHLLGTNLWWYPNRIYQAIDATNQPDWEEKGEIFVFHDEHKEDSILLSTDRVSGEGVHRLTDERLRDCILSLNEYRQDDGTLLGVGMGGYFAIYVSPDGTTFCDDCTEKALTAAIECGWADAAVPTAAISEAEFESDCFCDECGKQLAHAPEND